MTFEEVTWFSISALLRKKGLEERLVGIIVFPSSNMNMDALKLIYVGHDWKGWSFLEGFGQTFLHNSFKLKGFQACLNLHHTISFGPMSRLWLGMFLVCFGALFCCKIQVCLSIGTISFIYNKILSRTWRKTAALGEHSITYKFDCQCDVPFMKFC